MVRAGLAVDGGNSTVWELFRGRRIVVSDWSCSQASCRDQEE